MNIYKCWAVSVLSHGNSERDKTDPVFVFRKPTDWQPFPRECTLAISSVQFSSVAQSCPTLCDHKISECQASLSIINSRSVLKHMSIESVMPSSHLRSAWKFLFFFLISRLHSLLQFYPDDQYKCGVLNLRMLQFPDSEMLNGALLSENWQSTSLGILVFDYHLRDPHFEQPRLLFKYTSSYPL